MAKNLTSGDESVFIGLEHCFLGNLMVLLVLLLSYQVKRYKLWHIFCLLFAFRVTLGNIPLIVCLPLV